MTLFVTDGLAVPSIRHGQAVYGIQRNADDLVLEGQVVELLVTGVGQGEAVLHGSGGVDDAAVLDFLTVLVGLLVNVQGGVGDVHIGNNTHIGAPAVTLHVVEVELADLAVDQVQTGPTLEVVDFLFGVGILDALGAGDLAGGGVVNVLIQIVSADQVIKLLDGHIVGIAVLGHLRHHLTGLVNIVVDVDVNAGDGVGSTDIQNQLAVDEQVDVVVTFELEEQRVASVVDELTVGGQNVVVVPVDVGVGIGIVGTNVVIPEVVGIGLTSVVTLRVGNGQEGETGGPGNSVADGEVEVGLTGDQSLVVGIQRHGDGAGTAGAVGIDHGAVLHGGLVGAVVGKGGAHGGNLAGGEAGVKDVSITAMVIGGNRSHGHIQVVVVVLLLVEGVRNEQRVQHEVGCVHGGLDAVTAGFKLADQLLILLQGFLIGAQSGFIIGGIGTHVVADGQGNAQTMPQSGGQINLGLVAFLAIGAGTAVAVQIDHADDAVAVQVNAAELGAGSTGDEVGVVVAVGIPLGNNQRMRQQVGNVFHSFLTVNGNTVFHVVDTNRAQTALQQTGGHNTGGHTLQQLVAVEVQNLSIEAVGTGAVAVVGVTGRQEVDLVGGAGGFLNRTGAGGSIETGILLTGHGIPAVGGIVRIGQLVGGVAQHPGIVAISIGGVGAAGDGVSAFGAVGNRPVTAAGGIQHTEALVVTGVPHTGVAPGLAHRGGGAGGGRGVHVGLRLGAEGIGLSLTGEVTHIGQVNALAVGQSGQIQTGTGQTVGFGHIVVLGTDHRIDIHHQILPTTFGVEVLGVDIAGGLPSGGIGHQTGILPVAHDGAACTASGGIIIALCPDAVLIRSA